MGKKYVPDGVFLACDKGTCPSTYKVRFHNQTNIYSVPLASELDIVPFLNIKPMGFCMIKGMCTPMPLPWTGVKNDVLINGRLLLEDSKCRCMMGGEISIHFTRESANKVALWGGAKMPTEYIKDGFDWMAEQTAQGRKIQEEFLPHWARPIAGISNWMNDFNVGLIEGVVNGIVGLGETLYQVAQDPVGTAEGLYGMAEKGVVWASKLDNWEKTAAAAWNWASDGNNLVEAAANGVNWVKNNPRAIGNGLSEFAPDLVGAIYSGGGSLALSAGKKGLKELGQEAIEHKVDDALKASDNLADDAVEAGTGKIGREALEEALKKADGEMPVVEVGDIAKAADDAANLMDDAAKAAVESVKRWGEMGYDDLGKIQPCFLAGTIIKTPFGDKNIEEIQLGDLVFAYDFSTHIVVSKKVTKLYRNWTDKYFEIVTGNSQVNIRATAKHLFWIEEQKKWIPVKGFSKTIVALKTIKNSFSLVSTNEKCQRNLNTYNFEVDDLHNYFVGDIGILVHNNNRPSFFQSTSKSNIEFYKVVDANGKTVYIGQTQQGINTRFDQHIAEGAKKGNFKNDWGDPSRYRVQKITIPKQGALTPYEAHVWEKHLIEEAKLKGEPLQNKGNPIGDKKFDRFKNLHNPC